MLFTFTADFAKGTELPILVPSHRSQGNPSCDQMHTSHGTAGNQHTQLDKCIGEENTGPPRYTGLLLVKKEQMIEFCPYGAQLFRLPHTADAGH